MNVEFQDALGLRCFEVLDELFEFFLDGAVEATGVKGVRWGFAEPLKIAQTVSQADLRSYG